MLIFYIYVSKFLISFISLVHLLQWFCFQYYILLGLLCPCTWLVGVDSLQAEGFSVLQSVWRNLEGHILVSGESRRKELICSVAMPTHDRIPVNILSLVISIIEIPFQFMVLWPVLATSALLFCSCHVITDFYPLSTLAYLIVLFIVSFDAEMTF